MDLEYSKREIDLFMEEIRGQLNRIEAQTTRTNGRVTKLEFWRGMIMGGLAIMTTIILPVIFIVFQKLIEK